MQEQESQCQDTCDKSSFCSNVFSNEQEIVDNEEDAIDSSSASLAFYSSAEQLSLEMDVNELDNGHHWSLIPCDLSLCYCLAKGSAQVWRPAAVDIGMETFQQAVEDYG